MPERTVNPKYEVPLSQAIERLKVQRGDGDHMVHTFRQTGPILIGADHHLDNLIEQMKRYGVEESGPAATSMGHGMLLKDEVGPLFIETLPPKDDPDA